jgi:transketolase
MNILELERVSKKIRLQVFEQAIKAGIGHLGGTFSCIDLLVGLYYGGTFRFDPENSQFVERDRLILSKGHACLALYSIFLEKGFISRETYMTFGRDGGLGAQLDVSTPGVDWNTGSLGHSIGITAGISLALRLNGKSNYAFSIIGDAELSEGSAWEAIAFAGDQNLSNLVVIIDRNKLSVTEVLEDDAIYSNLGLKVESFGWNFVEIDGHSQLEIVNFLNSIRNSTKPTMLLANTIKGKGVSFMENQIKWHHAMPTPEEIVLARNELTDSEVAGI